MHPWRSRALRLVVFVFCSAAVLAQPGLLTSEPNTRTAADSVITFNEVMYHPAADDPGLEWIELYNQMSVNMDISGWRIQGGIEFRFPTNSVFPANTYLVIAADPPRMRALTGLTNIFGPFTNRLSNSGERLQLRNQSGRLLDDMDYLDEDPWPVGADGSGASLSKRDRFQASSPAANWRASQQPGGTPGRVNFEDRTAVVEPSATTILRGDAAARWHVPADGSLGETWIHPNFDDSGWAAGFASIGYDTGPSGPTALSNVALNKKVIAGSGAYNNNPFDVPDTAGNFTAQNVTDGSTSDIFGQNYWLGRQGRINEDFTLDLGNLFFVEEVRLRNTHNTQHNDRGTAEFELWAARSIDSSRQLISPARVLRGRLSNVMGLSTIPADVFTAANGLTMTTARYLRFVALTANNAGNNVGLNEIEVYAPTLIGPDRAYDFEGTVNDSSGNAVHGQNAGARFSTNVPAGLASTRSLEFDGVANQVTLADAKRPDAYTIALWVNASTVRSSSIIVRTDSSGTRASWSHQLRINGSGRFEHYLFDGTGRSVTASAAITPGVWNHVAITAANNGTMRIFVNGLASGGATAVGTLWTGGDQWRLGSDAGNAPNFFHGLVDDLALWHSVLEDTAIESLAAGRSPAQLGGLHRYVTTDLREALGGRTGAYLRVPFDHLSPNQNSTLTMRVRYADGFIAFLNGVELLRRNAPTGLTWDARALANRSVVEAVQVEAIDITDHTSKLTPGRNILAVQMLNSAPNEPESLFSAEILSEPIPITAVTNLALSEVSGISRPDFFVELANTGGTTASLAGCSILTSRGGRHLLTGTISPNAYVVVPRTNLGPTLQDGDRLFVLGPGGGVIDAVEIRNRGRGRLAPHPDSPWLYTSTATPGEPNNFQFRREIVINEIMYRHAPQFRSKDAPYRENEEQWIELYNISPATVDISGWRLAGEVTFTFPPGTVIPAEGYLVVARNAAQLQEKYPDISIVGNFPGRLSRHSGEIILLDPVGNPADQVRYHNSHPWPGHANGGGSSLELRDPRADNSVPESWNASDETGRSAWRRYSYRATAIRPVYTPNIYNFHEFRIGLLDEGEALIDNLSVTELPAGGAPRQLLQNTDFTTGTQNWRLLGNHAHSTATTNGFLHLVATGNTSYLDNRLETSLKAAGALVPVVTGREYEISFDAKWLAGSPQLRTELYYNKVANTTILEMPTLSGTPGRRNSRYVPNSGPTYRHLSHSPVVPRPSDAIAVEISAEDPDGVAQLVLYYSVNGGAWRTVAMASTENIFRATIPPQVNGAVIQIYVQGTDSLGAISTYPGRGQASRALIKVDSPRLLSDKQTFRTIMTPADSTKLHAAISMMSDDLLGCTVVHHEREIFYDARIRLHGSMFSRNDPSSVGLTVKFPADRRFRGTRESVIVRRRGLIENITKHILNSAGGVPGNYDDVVHLVSHRSDNVGSARLNLANYDDTFIESQFEGDDNGTVFKLEGIREYQTTQNGNPEGLKLSQPIGWILGYDIANLGDDPEQYRWGIMIQSDRRRDDFSSIVRMGKAFSLAGANLRQAAELAVDINSWARLFALQTLMGIGDVYGVDNPHNFVLYARPSDGRVVALQNDWEFAFALSAGSSIYGNKNVYKMLRLPGIQRLYQGHILDIIDSVANSAYITPWAQHYTAVFGHNFNSVPSYLAARSTAARSQLAPRIPFEISSNNGGDFSVDSQSVTLEGRGWIDVFRIERTGESAPLEVTWLDDQRWRATIPLATGTNVIELSAFNYRGARVGTDTIRVQTSATEFLQRDYLRISELMYNPAEPGSAETAAGFLSENDFEFVELWNIGPVPVSLLGVRFTVGITFNFSNGTITNLPPGGRVLVVNNQAGFEFRYGTNLPVTGEYDGALSNSGERIRLVDAAGGVIHDFTYDDAQPWPLLADGLGYSLIPASLDADYNDSTNWIASQTLGGSPGSAKTHELLVSSAVLADGELQFVFEAAAGAEYEVTYTEDLGQPAWIRLKLIPAQNHSRTERVYDSPVETARFYRVARR